MQFKTRWADAIGPFRATSNSLKSVTASVSGAYQEECWRAACSAKHSPKIRCLRSSTVMFHAKPRRRKERKDPLCDSAPWRETVFRISAALPPSNPPFGRPIDSNIQNLCPLIPKHLHAPAPEFPQPLLYPQSRTGLRPVLTRSHHVPEPPRRHPTPPIRPPGVLRRARWDRRSLFVVCLLVAELRSATGHAKRWPVPPAGPLLRLPARLRPTPAPQQFRPRLRPSTRHTGVRSTVPKPLTPNYFHAKMASFGKSPSPPHSSLRPRSRSPSASSALPTIPAMP